ncbi:hypothetical protein ACJ41O_004747 [Fusarium nematophilum]
MFESFSIRKLAKAMRKRRDGADSTDPMDDAASKGADGTGASEKAPDTEPSSTITYYTAVTALVGQGQRIMIFTETTASISATMTYLETALAPTATGDSAPDPPDSAAERTGTSAAENNGSATKTDTASTTSEADSADSTITSQSNSSHGLSDGAAAGLAIGCLIAGLALGIIAALLFLRRRRRSGKGSEMGLHQTDKQNLDPKGDVLVTVTPSKNDVELSQFLLDAVPDKQIEGELHSLSELIFQHIENHYHRSPIQIDPAVLAQSLIHIGYSPASSGLDAEYVAALCLDPKTRQVGLRHVLSHAIFRSLDFSSGSSLSMLPPAVAAFLQTIPPAVPGNPGQNAAATSLALSRWRSLSTLLLHPAPAERTPLPVSAAEASPQAGILANELNALLHFFVAQDPASHQNQTSHLQAVILECTRLGYVLISQPSDWRFMFGTAQSRAVVVCPGLEKLSHSDGNRYTSPREAVAVVTMVV